jgi:hypothetical protein
VISTEDTTDKVVDDAYVFRGFLAWCLWGWIPLETGAKIKSSLFTDGKASASYGRKTMLRLALKSAKHAHAAKTPVVPAAKKTLTITIPDTKHDERTSHRESTTMLKWALDLFKADLAEKELQKRLYLEALIVRDKLAAVTRKSDRLTEKYYQAKKGSAANEMKLLLEKYHEEIELLEQQLQDIQKMEMERRQQAAESSNPPSTDKEEVRVHSAIASSKPSSANTEQGTVCSMIVVEDVDMVSFDAAATPSTAAGGARASQSKSCIERNTTPSTHKCRKCKESICDLCCSSKRNLEMVWWCRRCFDKESLTNQRQI